MFRNCSPRIVELVACSKKVDGEFVVSVNLNHSPSGLYDKKINLIRQHMEDWLCDLDELDDVQTSAWFFYNYWRFRRAESRVLYLLPYPLVKIICNYMVCDMEEENINVLRIFVKNKSLPFAKNCCKKSIDELRGVTTLAPYVIKVSSHGISKSAIRAGETEVTRRNRYFTRKYRVRKQNGADKLQHALDCESITNAQDESDDSG